MTGTGARLQLYRVAIGWTGRYGRAEKTGAGRDRKPVVSS